MALYGVNPITRAHILDNHSFGGGNNANKTKFPQSWSDNEIIIAVEAVANDPASTSAPTGDVGRLKVKGNRNNLPIAVIVEIGGLIVSGWPRRPTP
jgi:Bacterial EndoU nuclease